MTVRLAGLVFDRAARRLVRGGQAVELSPKAFALLEALVDAHPAALSKETLYERLWPGVFVEPGNLHNLIFEIRTALGDREHTLVRTVHRFGYALAGPIEGQPRWQLRVGGREVALREGENVIGRDAAAEVVIDTADVSRRHARITVDGESVTIEDLDSKNGTFVGSQRIDAKTELREGGEVVFGRTRATLYRTHGDSTETA